MTSSLAPLRAALERELFTPRQAQTGAPLVGAEVELIPVLADLRSRVPVAGPRPSSFGFLRRLGRTGGWTEGLSAKGTPWFLLPDGGRITFEPGGQIEASSPPLRSASLTGRYLEAVVGQLHQAAAEDGIELLALGVDPVNSLASVPLQFDNDRYPRMDRYFESIGPAGAVMMRQTATTHINVELGPAPALRWQVLNALAPYLVAIFANSSWYDGEPTGYQSYRAETWRTLDWSRTGLVGSGREMAQSYLEFALDAPAILRDPVDGEYPSFSWYWNQGRVSLMEWREHLSTLFPEIRPRGYFEIRSADSLPVHWLVVPICLLVGLVYDPATLAATADLLGQPKTALLHVAGARGLRDKRLGGTAVDLFDLAIQGCRRLGPAYVTPADLERTIEFGRRYTASQSTLADDHLVQGTRAAVGAIL